MYLIFEWELRKMSDFRMARNAKVKSGHLFIIFIIIIVIQFYDLSILDVDFSRKSMLYKGSCSDPYLFVQKTDNLKSRDDSFKSTCYNGQDSRCHQGNAVVPVPGNNITACQLN